MQGRKGHAHSWDLPLSRSVTGGLAPPGGIEGGETDAAAAKDDGEVQGEELPPWPLSAGDKWRRSRPDNAAALAPPSEGAKGSLRGWRGRHEEREVRCWATAAQMEMIPVNADDLDYPVRE